MKTSCPCIRVAGPPLHVEPGESVGLQVEYQPDDTPDFQGMLTIRLTGLGAGGSEVFWTEVHIQILPGDAGRRVAR